MGAITRRRSLFVLAGLAFTGCAYVGGRRAPAGTTELRSGVLPTTTPLLAMFVLRLAASQLSLDEEKAHLAQDLVREADRVHGRVGEARILFAERLVHALAVRRWDQDGIVDAATALVASIRTAAPRLLYLLAKLHHALEPAQRADLVALVEARFDGWRPAWDGGTPADHPWVRTLADAAFPRDNALVDDAVRTARRWAAARMTEVRTELGAPSLDDGARRQLVDRLRS